MSGGERCLTRAAALVGSDAVRCRCHRTDREGHAHRDWRLPCDMGKILLHSCFCSFRFSDVFFLFGVSADNLTERGRNEEPHCWCAETRYGETQDAQSNTATID